MLKLTKDHTIFEIHNGWAAESVYIDHRPTYEELEFICDKEWPNCFDDRNSNYPLEKFIKKYVSVEKEQHMYTATAKAKRDKYHAERGED